MDGGSTDGTLDILRKYEGRLRYESRPDRGQTDAINQGFYQSRGSVFAFLCADDTYLPGAIGRAVHHLMAHPGHAGIYGEGYMTDATGAILGRYPTREFDPELLDRVLHLPARDLPAARRLPRGRPDERRSALRPGLRSVDPPGETHTLLKVDDYLAASRMHGGSKTLRQRAAVFKASIDLLKAHYGYAPYAHIYGYCCALLDRRDGFFEPLHAFTAQICRRPGLRIFPELPASPAVSERVARTGQPRLSARFK